MTEAERIASQIMIWLPQLNGALRLWGAWAGGKHFDNCYRAVACHGEDDLLRIDFGAGETLRVWRPRGDLLQDEVFCIADADRVHFEWCYTADGKSRCFDFARTQHGLIGSHGRAPQPDRREPAVELIAFTATNLSRYQ
jgi:hypothetical protein